jgi:molybdenum cofactor biosynthesis enzyme
MSALTQLKITLLNIFMFCKGYELESNIEEEV